MFASSELTNLICRIPQGDDLGQDYQARRGELSMQGLWLGKRKNWNNSS